MDDELELRAGRRVLRCSAHGRPLAGAQDAVDLLARAREVEAEVVAVPVERLTGDFFRLRSGVAGAVVQPFVDYGLPVAFVGPLPDQGWRGRPFRAFATEADRGRAVWFVADLAALDARLAR